MTDPVADEIKKVAQEFREIREAAQQQSPEPPRQAAQPPAQAPQVERKPLSQAQQRRLRVLAERRDAAQGALDEFIGYLTEEHDAPVQDGWRLSLEAFERQNGA